MNKFVYRMLCKNYEASAKAMLAEWRKFKNDVSIMRSDVTSEYLENLRLLRQFLDNEFGAMPKAKWFYDDKDESTWLFTHRKGINKTFLLLQSRQR